MLLKKRFTTKDADGLDFVVTAYYGDRECKDGEFARDCKYTAMGLESSKLESLKKMVANLD